MPQVPLSQELAASKPALRPQVRIHRHVYRGSVWYVLHDLASGENYRFNPAAYALIRESEKSLRLDELDPERVGTGQQVGC